MKICKKFLLAVVFSMYIVPIGLAQATEPNNGSISDNGEIIQENETVRELRHDQQKKGHLYLSLYAFMPKIDGTIGIGNKKVSPDIPFSEIWDNLDSAFMGNLDIKKGKWGLSFDQQYAKVSIKEQAGISVAPNATIPLNVNLTTELNRSSVGIYYTALDSSDRQRKKRFVLEPTVGIHFTNASARIDASSPVLPYSLRENRSVFWTEPYLGARFLFELNPKWNLSGQVDFGSKNSKGYQIYLGYRTKIFNLPADIRVGYRMIDQKHKEGDFNWHIKEHGPVIGVSLKFY